MASSNGFNHALDYAMNYAMNQYSYQDHPLSNSMIYHQPHYYSQTQQQDTMISPGSSARSTPSVVVAAKPKTKLQKRNNKKNCNIKANTSGNSILNDDTDNHEMIMNNNNNISINNHHHHHQHQNQHNLHSNQSQTHHVSGITKRKTKRIRTTFTPEQLKVLEENFAMQMYLVGDFRETLAKSLNLSEGQVKVWFQNRRIKMRKLQVGQPWALLMDLLFCKTPGGPTVWRKIEYLVIMR